MRFSHLATCSVLLFVGLGFTNSSAGDEKKNIKPTQRWGGKNGDDTKKKAAPKSGYLTSQDQFETLWKAFGVKGDAPKIDFKKQIVFVQLASGPNAIATGYTLDGKGNLTALSRQTLIGGPGFGYGIDVLDREGIKSYNGKPIE